MLLQVPQRPQDFLNYLLEFVYTFAHAAGLAIVMAVQRIIPSVPIPLDLVDPVGFLAVLTIFVVVAGIARRIAWIIVMVGWALIAVRVALLVLKR